MAGWRWGGGWGPGLAGGLIAGAVIGGIASNAYAYGPGYGYYGGPGYGYGGGYAPAYYGGGTRRITAMATLPHITADTGQDMLQPTTVPAASFVPPTHTAALVTIGGIAIAGDRRSRR